FGPRSTSEAAERIQEFFDVPVKPLELVSNRYYHLDTCFVTLSGGEVLYYPSAFSKMALSVIREHVPADALIEASDEDAERFAVNAVSIAKDVIMAEPTSRLADQLGERGYSVTPLNLKPFIMAGGGAYCMTLRLDLESKVAGQ
ncbi:MAG TPA: amidinotransferase, partial [Hyphomicrobiales bacterium]|nr:amidinotransferase [Hyphomicrobiales bacterium]